MKVTLLAMTPEPEKTIEFSSRLCYASGDKIAEGTADKLLSVLLKNGHLSVFEHACASFHIEGISRACTHQLVRQRLASFSQQSQRYVKEAAFDYVTPPEVSEKPEAKQAYDSLMRDIQAAYNRLTELGIKKEDARFVLPNACETTLSMTANFREWLHIIDLRVSTHAQWEIRELLILVWKELYLKAPVVFGDTYFKHWSKDFDYKSQIFEKRIRGGN